MNGWRWVIPPIAVAGAFVCGGQLAMWVSIGAWPPHDTAAYYLAGLHLREGAPVYGAETAYLAFLYAPPWAVLSAAASFLPFELVAALLFGAQVLALRYIVGSWRNVGLVAWLPVVPRELVTGNVDLLMAAAILIGIRGRGVPAALFTFAKLSPVLVLTRPSRRLVAEFAITSIILVALTGPWLGMWGEWIAAVDRQTGQGWLPILPRIPVLIGLLLVRRPWALAAAIALSTPAFHFHSVVLLLPAGRLLLEGQPSFTRVIVPVGPLETPLVVRDERLAAPNAI